ncbi:MAG: acyl-CoA dehydrogenase family protein [Acidimicrobiia bacterium]
MSLAPASSVPADLLERIERVRPVIEAHRAAGETGRRLAEPVRAALRSERLYSMLVPTELGGLDVGALAALAATELLARIDSAVGWNANQANGGALMASRLSPAAIDRLFGGRSLPPVFAGAAAPMCRAVPVEGGYEVTGEVRFVSGCEDADWIFAMAAIPDPDGGPAPKDVRFVFAPAADVRKLDTWHVMGMRATGSHNVHFDGLRIDEELTASVMAQNPPAPMYRPGVVGVSPWPLLAGEAVVSLGIGASAIEEAVSIVTAKVPNGSQKVAAEREVTQADLARARATIEGARAYLDHALSTAVAVAERGETLERDLKVSLQLACCTAAEAGAAAADLAYRAAGTDGFLERHGLERHVRDAHVLTQHGTKSFPKYVSAGKAIVGLPSDAPMLN